MLRQFSLLSCVVPTVHLPIWALFEPFQLSVRHPFSGAPPIFPGFRDPLAGAESVDRTAHEKRSKRFFPRFNIYLKISIYAKNSNISQKTQGQSIYAKCGGSIGLPYTVATGYMVKIKKMHKKHPKTRTTHASVLLVL